MENKMKKIFVATWMIRKLGTDEYFAINESTPYVFNEEKNKSYYIGRLLGETEKAYKVSFATRYGFINGWFPKSQCYEAKPVIA